MSQHQDGRREARVPLHFAQSEIDEIDNWRFANRIGTRAEAIRRLISLGLSSSKENANAL